MSVIQISFPCRYLTFYLLYKLDAESVLARTTIFWVNYASMAIHFPLGFIPFLCLDKIWEERSDKQYERDADKNRRNRSIKENEEAPLRKNERLPKIRFQQYLRTKIGLRGLAHIRYAPAASFPHKRSSKRNHQFL